MGWPDKANLEYWAAIATIAGAIVGVGAIIYAARQLRLARKTSSVSSLTSLAEAFRHCWLGYVGAADDVKKTYAFADLMNTIEIACASFRDGVYYGASEELLKQYLIDVFIVIEASADSRQRLVGCLQTPTTFRNIRLFLETHRRTMQSQRASLGTTTTPDEVGSAER